MSGPPLLVGVAAVTCLYAFLGCGDGAGGHSVSESGHSSGCVVMAREEVDLDAERNGVLAQPLRAGAGEWMIDLTWASGGRARVTVESQPTSAPQYVDYEPLSPDSHVGCPDRFEQGTMLSITTDDDAFAHEGPGTVFVGAGGQPALTADVDPQMLIESGRLEREDWTAVTFLLALGSQAPRGSLSARTESETPGGRALIERTVATMP